MRNYYSKPNNSKIIVYAVVAAILAGIVFVAFQDITVPTEHTVKKIEVNLKK